MDKMEKRDYVHGRAINYFAWSLKGQRCVENEIFNAVSFARARQSQEFKRCVDTLIDSEDDYFNIHIFKQLLKRSNFAILPADNKMVDDKMFLNWITETVLNALVKGYEIGFKDSFNTDKR